MIQLLTKRYTKMSDCVLWIFLRKLRLVLFFSLNYDVTRDILKFFRNLVWSQKFTYTGYFLSPHFSCERDFNFLKNFVSPHFSSHWLVKNGMTHILSQANCGERKSPVYYPYLKIIIQHIVRKNGCVRSCVM